MINTVQTTVKGRTYEVIADSDKVNEAMHCYVQVIRLRKDGSHGRHLAAHRPEAWAVWQTVRDQIKALEAAPSKSLKIADPTAYRTDKGTPVGR
jgi:hypothetical protein